jgi:hypothetical protein
MDRVLQRMAESCNLFMENPPLRTPNDTLYLKNVLSYLFLTGPDTRFFTLFRPHWDYWWGGARFFSKQSSFSLLIPLLAMVVGFEPSLLGLAVGVRGASDCTDWLVGGCNKLPLPFIRQNPFYPFILAMTLWRGKYTATSCPWWRSTLVC